MPICQQEDVLSGRLMILAGGRAIKRDLIDLDHNVGKRLAFRMASFDLLIPLPSN
jgi:hypothetical protein